MDGRLTLEEALKAPGEKIAAFDRFAEPGTAWIGLYRVGEAGADLLAWDRMAADGGDARKDELIVLGVRIGWTCSPGEFVWVADEAGFAAWSLDALQACTRGEMLVGRQGEIRRQAVRVVQSGLGEDLGHRCVWAVTADGSRLLVAEERDDAAHLDPTYDGVNVMIDAAWGTFMGRDLARWLGVAHQDDLPGGVSSPAPGNGGAG